MDEPAGAWILGDVIATGDFAEVRAARRAAAVAPDADTARAIDQRAAPDSAGAAVDPAAPTALAIKRLHAHAAREPALRALFGAEAALTCALPVHPRLVRGLASDLDGDQPYLVMERIDGGDLRARLGQPQPRAITAAIVAGAAHAAAHLHGCGWVHGDLGPANLLLCPGRGAVVCDLGVARRLDEAGPVRGTAAYMAPEQVQGAPWTAAVDVFALGVIAWELATGARLFHRGASYLTMAAVVETSAPPLGDPRLAPIVAAALARDPDARPSAAALAAALEAAAR